MSAAWRPATMSQSCRQRMFRRSGRERKRSARRPIIRSAAGAYGGMLGCAPPAEQGSLPGDVALAYASVLKARPQPAPGRCAYEMVAASGGISVPQRRDGVGKGVEREAHVFIGVHRRNVVFA